MNITYKTIDILKQQVAETTNYPAHSNLNYLIYFENKGNGFSNQAFNKYKYLQLFIFTY